VIRDLAVLALCMAMLVLTAVLLVHYAPSWVHSGPPVGTTTTTALAWPAVGLHKARRRPFRRGGSGMDRSGAPGAVWRALAALQQKQRHGH
jgi:hypothetical protein